LKQCIHDGFGLIRFGEKLSGPEYAARFTEELRKTNVQVRIQTFVSRIRKTQDGFVLTLTGKTGIDSIDTKALIFSTGCRERTARQIAIHGTRPAGVLTAGSAQYYTNVLGQLPGRRCIILGSGDIGLIMARRLHLEGAEVLGVYEAKPTPSGLSRNVAQCLNDFDIPLHTSKTVTRVFGQMRLEAVEIASVDEAIRPITGTEERITCDCLILSVGLIPENELAESLGVPMHGATKGPVADQHYMTMIPGIFCCGNALQVNDLVDYVSESGEKAGKTAAHFTNKAGAGWTWRFTNIEGGADFLCVTPQKLDIDHIEAETILFFRVKQEMGKTTVRINARGINGSKELFRKTYNQLRPPEMERITLDLRNAGLREGDVIEVIS
jgi:thioredoxin reductase